MAGPARDTGDEENEGMREMPQAVRYFALSATAEFLIFLGVIFILLGVAGFVTDLLGIKGSGDVLVGFFLVFIGLVLFLWTRQGMRPGPQAPRQPAARKEQAEGSSQYR